MNISVCMICRDEEEHIERCLNSVFGVADEIIIADTGSKDSSAGIARNLGARVFDFPWDDDFAAARNASLEPATGDWIFVIDADEELPGTEAAKLRAFLEHADHAAYTVRIRSKVGGGESAFYVTNTHTRLFRNRLGITYAGRIHEDIRESVEAAGETIGASNVELVHHGYTEDAYSRKSKADRNIKLLEKMRGENPADGHVAFYLGEAFSLKNDWEKAIRHYREALSDTGLRQEFRALTHQNLATALLKTGRCGQCRAEARKAIEADRRLTAPHLVAGAAAFEENRFDLAIFHLSGYLDTLERAAASGKTQPVYTESGKALAFELLGRSCYKSNNWEDALRWFGKWKEESGDNSEILLWKARVHGAAGNQAAAEDLLEKLMSENPRNADVISETGILRMKQGRNSDALKLLRDALALNPYSIPVRIEIGKVYLAIKDYRAACEILEEAWRMGNRKPETGQLLAEACILSGRYPEAGEVLRILRKEGHTTGALEYLEGLLEKHAGNISGAVDKFKSAMKFPGLKPEFYFACGNVLMELERFSEAIEAFEIAINLAPSVKEPYHNAGVAYIRQKKYAEAIEKFEMILKLEPDSRHMMRTLAGLYGKIGELQKAELYLYRSNI